jgi:hypothetical protein
VALYSYSTTRYSIGLKQKEQKDNERKEPEQKEEITVLNVAS